MSSEKILTYSIVLSLILHTGVILFPGFHFINQKLKKTEFKDVRVNYYILDQKIKNEPRASVIQEVKKEPIPPTPKLEPKPKSKLKAKISPKETAEQKVDATKIKKEDVLKKEVVLPDLPSNFPNRPEYLNYYQVVREKIKDYAYKNYAGDSTGEVFLIFTVLSNGSLSDLGLIEEKSVENKFLKSIALKSVRYASPFPPFPREIVHPRLKFNIIICFELKK